MYITVADQAKLLRIEQFLKSCGFEKTPEYSYLHDINLKLKQERETGNDYQRNLKRINRKTDKGYGRGRPKSDKGE